MSYPSPFTRPAEPADAVRVTEAERERAIRALRERYARGELSGDELDEKLDALLAVQTTADAGSSAITVRAADVTALERHLSPDERIEWVGKPDPAKHFTRADVFLIPFSILWGGFAIFWEASAIGGGGGFFALWGIPFVAIGLYFIGGRFIYKANRKRRTTYAVTDRRVLTLVRGRRGESVDAMYLRSIPSIATNADSDGRGNVEFGVSSPAAGWYANSGMELFGRGQSAGLGFYDIDDARAVADLVEGLRDPDHAR